MATDQNTVFPIFSQLYSDTSSEVTVSMKELFKQPLAFEFKHLKPVSMAELEKRLGDVLIDCGADIARWSDYSFTTAEGRTFALFLDGKSIEHRLRAASVLVTAKDTARLARTAGFILEVDAEEPPFVFEDQDALVKAWVEHHEAYGVPLSEIELEPGIFPVTADDEADEA